MKQFSRRFISFVLSLAFALTLASNVAPAQAAVKLVVDDNFADCPTAGYSNLQTAINALGSNPGTITVCAGTYYGPFTVINANKLTITGKPGAVITHNAGTFNGSLFNVILSSKVTVQGLTFDGLGKVGSSAGNTALQYSESSGKIMKNTIQNWHTLNYASTAYEIYSIYLTSGNLQSLTVSKNIIIAYQGRAMQIEGRSKVSVSGNELYAGANNNNTAIGIYTLPIGSGYPSGSIKGNKINGGYTGSGTVISTGIVLFETSGMSISSNTINYQTQGISVFAGCSYLPTADNNKIAGNKLNEVLAGISIESKGNYCDTSANKNKVTGNKIKNTLFKGTSGISFSASSTSYHGYALNEVGKGNSITYFNYGVFQFQGTNGTLSGTFAPNNLSNVGP